MIETDGYITVAEAAKRLHRSTEQVRRNLREGKLRGQRIGNQWFVDEAELLGRDPTGRWLISRELLEQIRRSREETFTRNGIIFDIVAELREDRESH